MAGVRQFDEQEVLGRALEIFETRGFRATSILDLAAGTGVRRGSLYHAYGDKEDACCRATARERARRSVARLLISRSMSVPRSAYTGPRPATTPSADPAGCAAM